MSPLQKVLPLILLSVAMGSVGQYFFKSGMTKIGEVTLGFQVITYFFRPMIFLGLLCYAAATVLWLVILSKAPLSLVYPFISVSYIVVVLMGQFVFKERVHWIAWAGVALICVGVFFVGLGSEKGRQDSLPTKASAPIELPSGSPTPDP